MFQKSRLRLAIVVTVALGALATAAAVVAAKNAPRDVTVAGATLVDATGKVVAVVQFRKSPRSAVKVSVAGHDLPPGFHGMHVHAIGACEAPTFMSAGGHVQNEGTSHSDHTGDLTSLYVKSDGTVSVRFETDRFGLDTLRDMDGSAVMIHALPDNFGNIPARYSPTGPDQATRDTGDSGARIACGPVK
ncbi:MAG TPA: superoxide dismutase family protein [Solirubrobacteraceae bacterium]|jgi:Cu-Zn family superoxide dismutase|nr:superoxide dismutase family protein [Solirubrobacteraceae bacterium]